MQAEKYLRNSGLSWVIVRPGGLSNASPGEVGNLVLRGEDQLFGRQELDAVCLDVILPGCCRAVACGLVCILPGCCRAVACGLVCNTMLSTIILAADLGLTDLIAIIYNPGVALQEGRPWTFHLQADGEAQERLAQGACWMTCNPQHMNLCQDAFEGLAYRVCYMTHAACCSAYSPGT